MKVLTGKYGFGSYFCRWIEVLYNNAVSCVMNGGFSTGYFEIGRGVRQGDLLSPYLFLLIIETLALVIRNDQNFKGISIGNIEMKLVMYADDCSIFLKDTEDMKILENIMASFSQVSGLRINKDKTHIMKLGSSGQSYDDFSSITLGKIVSVVKVLGVHFSLDINVKEEINYKEILSKIKKLLGWWKQRDLTLFGKIQLVKVFAISKLLYVSSIMTVPQWVFKEMETICFNFIWNGHDKIRRNILYMNYDSGGLKMLNFKYMVCAQRVMWIKRLIYGHNDMKWKQFFDFIFKTVGGRLIFLCNYNCKSINIKVPDLYLEFLNIWNYLQEKKFIVKETHNENQIIFHNTLIKGRIFQFNEKLFDANIFQVKHLVDTEGNIRSGDYFIRKGLFPTIYFSLMMYTLSYHFLGRKKEETEMIL